MNKRGRVSPKAQTSSGAAKEPKIGSIDKNSKRPKSAISGDSEEHAAPELPRDSS